MICHNLFHDFTECSGFAISACRRKVDRRQGERLCHLRGMRSETRAHGSTPSRGDGLVNGDGRRSKRRKCLLRVSIKGTNVLWLGDSDGNGLRRERVWSTFQMQSLGRKMSANVGGETASYRERSSVHEGQYEYPMTGKPLTGIKTGWTRGRTQTPSCKRLKDVFVRLTDSAVSWP